MSNSDIDPFASPFDGPVSIGANKVSASLKKISAHPATKLTLAATATVVPFGSALAGAAVVGLAVAGAIAKVAEPIGKALAAISPFKGLKKKRRNRKARKVVEGYSNAQLRALLDSAKKLQNVPGAVGYTAKLRVKNYTAELKRRGTEESKEIGTAARQLLQVGKAAGKGDSKASAELLAVQVLTNPRMIRAKIFATGLEQGLPESRARALANSAQKESEKKWKRVLAASKELAKKEGLTLPKPPKVDLKKSREAIEKGASVLESKAISAAKKRGALRGVVVTEKGKVSSGRFANNKGARGWLVTTTGRVIPGSWESAK